MAFKKAYVFLLAIIILFLPSCHKKTSNTIKVTTISKVVNIAINKDMPEHIVESTQVFADKITELSQGRLSGKIIVSDNTVEDVKNGKADLAMSENSRIVSDLENFNIFNSSFYFRDLNTALMTLNSESFKEIINPYVKENINGNMLGAMYKTSNLLVSSGGYITSPTSFAEADAYISNEEDLAAVMGSLCGSVEFASSDAILSILNQDTPIVGELPIKLTDKIREVSGSRTIHVIKTPISYDFYWLIANDDFFVKLSQQEKDIVLDAKSYLCADVTNKNIGKDYEYENLMLSKSITIIERGFADLRSFALNAIKNSENFKEMWDTELYNSILQIIK